MILIIRIKFEQFFWACIKKIFKTLRIITFIFYMYVLCNLDQELSFFTNRGFGHWQQIFNTRNLFVSSMSLLTKRSFIESASIYHTMLNPLKTLILSKIC